MSTASTPSKIKVPPLSPAAFTPSRQCTCPQFDVGHLHLSDSIPVGAGAISQVVRSHLFFSHSGLKTPICVKILSKIQLLKQRKVESVLNEKEALLLVAPFPFIGRLFGTAQSEDELYFVMEWLPHGDLLQHLRRCTLARQKEYWENRRREMKRNENKEPNDAACDAPACGQDHENETFRPPVASISPPEVEHDPKTPPPEHEKEKREHHVLPSRTTRSGGSASLLRSRPAAHHHLKTSGSQPVGAPSRSSCNDFPKEERGEDTVNHRKTLPVASGVPSTNTRKTSSSSSSSPPPPVPQVGSDPTTLHPVHIVASSSTSSLPPAPLSDVTPIPPDSRAIRCLGFTDIQLIASQLILSLDRIFSKGLVLRDLKPENIVFDDHYRACFIDFDTVDLGGAGLLPLFNDGSPVVSEEYLRERSAMPAPSARPGDASGTPPPPTTTTTPKTTARPSITVSEIQRMRERNSSFCGTAQYVSPEMAGSCSWSFSSDLWALGTTLYECAYGKAMFSGACTYEVLQKIVRGGEPALHVPFPPINFTSPTSSSLHTMTTADGCLRSTKGNKKQDENAKNGFEKKEEVMVVKDEALRSDSRFCLLATSSPVVTDKMEKEEGLVGSSLLISTIKGAPDTLIESTSGRAMTGLSPFERLKDFILRLVVLNPRERLGVERATGKWNIKALREHPLFEDFDWSIVDEHVRKYRAHDFRNPPSLRCTSAASSLLPCSTKKEGEEVCVYDDGTLSLASHYTDLPFHEEKYAAYVFETTADTDPFEQFLLRAAGVVKKEAENLSHTKEEGRNGAGAKEGEKATKEDEGKEERDVKNERHSGKAVGPEEEKAPLSSDEDDDVIDDVGVHLHSRYDDAFSNVFAMDQNDKEKEQDAPQ